MMKKLFLNVDRTKEIIDKLESLNKAEKEWGDDHAG